MTTLWVGVVYLLFRVVALLDLLVADHLVGSNNELRLGVPLMVGYIISKTSWFKHILRKC